ncbi:transcriptional regulator GcvA [Bradyrhizobium sp. AZCC 2230]|uniref:transcriptional regulator GcvA n=1 Tax=Bradyrhizobium sp. AZCC 2230 TaxID=3117021 RepID=UPI002FF3F535
MSNYLPSMTSLRVFEAAARHLSFSRAARELNLTQTAVSHQIKNLEALLGSKLFVREPGSLRLTDTAHDYLSTVRPLIVEISEATTRAMDRKKEGALYLGCTASFALKLLIPSLAHFRAKHPHIALRFGTIVSTESMKRADYDVSIRYGSGDWPGFESVKLSDEEIFPVCSPLLLKNGPPLKTPADLAKHTIIRTAFSYILRDDWPLWLVQANEPNLEFANEIVFDLLFPSVQAAIDGLGVVIGRTPMVLPDLASGQLVEPFSIRLPSELGMYLVSPKERAQLPQVRLFQKWALQRFGSQGDAP